MTGPSTNGQAGEAAVEAGAEAVRRLLGGDWRKHNGGAGLSALVLEAASDPSLGDERLVPAGEHRQEVIAEVVEALRAFALGRLDDGGCDGYCGFCDCSTERPNMNDPMSFANWIEAEFSSPIPDTERAGRDG